MRGGEAAGFMPRLPARCQALLKQRWMWLNAALLAPQANASNHGAQGPQRQQCTKLLEALGP